MTLPLLSPGRAQAAFRLGRRPGRWLRPRWHRPRFDRAQSVLAAISFAIYVGSIAGANWMISHVGQVVQGSHYLPVGFGLNAPSGVYLAALTFVARDIVQRLAGTRAGLVAIVVGAAISWWVSSAALAVASGATFLVSESCDFLVYTPLQSRNFPLAVAGSGLVGDAIDSTLFLTLAGIPLSVALPGQLVGKAWVMLAGGLLAALLRRHGPFKAPVTGRSPVQAARPSSPTLPAMARRGRWSQRGDAKVTLGSPADAWAAHRRQRT